MSDLRLAFAYLRSRPLVTVLTTLSVALGLCLATMVLVVARQAMDTLRNETTYWDLVVGAKGSPLQLVLNSIYYLQAPVGNIHRDLWDRLLKNPAVANVTVVNMGDSYLGSPIIGTSQDFFAGRNSASGGNLLAQGTLFTHNMEAVLGSQVADLDGLKLGSQFCGSHGWSRGGDVHTKFKYTVVGILAPTGTSIDRALFTDYRSVWEIHANPDADEVAEAREAGITEKAADLVTTLLVKLKQPGRARQIQQDINLHWAAMAVEPSVETNNLLNIFIEPLRKVLLAVAYLVVLVSALSILISLYLTIHQRRRDLAILRSLGATQLDIFRLITLEAAALAALGVVAGWLIGHAVLAVVSPAILYHVGIGLNAWKIEPIEFVIMASVWLLGIVAGLLPAAIAYRLPVAETLQRE